MTYEPPVPPESPPPYIPGPGQPAYPPHPAMPPAPRKRKVLTIVLAGVGILALLCCGGGIAIALTSGGKDNTATSPTSLPSDRVTATARDTTPPTTEPAAAPATAAATTVPPAPAAPKDVVYQGRGDKVVRLKLDEDTAYIAAISHRGSSNFVVTSLTAEGDDIDLLVNEIGRYSGVRPLSFNDTPAALKVEADGTWKIVVRTAAKAPLWSGNGSGKGDAVLRVADGVATGLGTVTITHKGSSNFVVSSYETSSGDLLVNEIGKYNGEVLLPSGTLIVEIVADGNWTMRKV